MEFEALMAVANWLVPWVICVVIGIIGAMATGVMAIVGRKAPAALGAVGIGLASIGAMVTALIANSMAAGATGEEAWQLLLAGAMVRFCAWFGAVILASIHLVLLAVAGLRHPPRSMTWAAAGLLLGALAGLVALVAGVVLENQLYWGVRAGGYFLGAICVALALSGRGPEEGHQAHTGGSAALVFALFVATSEMAARGMVKLMGLWKMASITVADRAGMLDGYLEVMDEELLWHYLLLGLATAMGTLGVAAASRNKLDFGAVAGVVWIALIWALWFVGDVGRDAIFAAVSTLPEPAAAG